MSEPKIGIIGVGWVGSQIKRYFEEIRGLQVGSDLLLYDIDPKKRAGDISLADVIFVTVPTPPRADGSCDTSAIHESLKLFSAPKIFVIKSTAVPGTTEKLQENFPEHKFLFNPEFLTESRAWEDFLRPDRQIVGFTESSMDAAHLVLSLLPKAPFMSPWGIGTYDQIRISATEAEFIKYAANIHFVRKVNWANALAKSAGTLGADYENIRKGMAADHRIGDSHLNVNHGGYRGFGGSCFPKDISAFIAFAKSAKLTEVAKLLEQDWNFNESILNEQGLSYKDVSRHINEIKVPEAVERNISSKEKE